MLVLYRKCGEGIEVKNKFNDETFDFDFLYQKGSKTVYKINGEERTIGDRQPFYLDPNAEVMVIVISTDHAIRVGVDAPRHYQIRRKEIPYK